MRFMRAYLVGVIVLAFASAASAATLWTRGGFYSGAIRTSGPQNSQYLACARLSAALTSAGVYPGNWRLTYNAGLNACTGVRGPTNEAFDDRGFASWTTTTGSPIPDVCDSVATTANAMGGSVRNGSGSTSGTFCGQVLGSSDTDVHQCEATVVGVVTKSGSKWSAQMHWTGRSCDVAADAGGPDVGAEGGANCVSNSAGTVCASRSERNCGTFNGERVCLAAVPPGRCVLLAGGGAVCDSSAASPPAPDNGSGGAATPDAQVQLVSSGGTSTTFNFFGGSTVGASASPVQGAEPGSAAHDPADGETGGDGSDAEPPDGYGELPDDVANCAGDVAGCAQGKATGAYANLVAHVPLLSLVSTIDAALDSSASCPVYPLTFFDHEYDVMASVCSVVDTNAALLSLVFQVGWSFAALRILLKAE